MQKENLAAIRQIDKSYIYYLIQMPPSEAKELLSALQNDLEKIVDAIGEVVPPMQYGQGNPNNGLPHHEFMIGNEGSRVIYLKIAKNYLPKDFNYKTLSTKLHTIAKKFKADEHDETENKQYSYEFRFWWD